MLQVIIIAFEFLDSLSEIGLLSELLLLLRHDRVVGLERGDQLSESELSDLLGSVLSGIVLLGDCDVPVVDLLLTDDSDEVVVGGEGGSDLLSNSIVSFIDVSGVALEDESVGDLVSELLVLLTFFQGRGEKTI